MSPENEIFLYTTQDGETRLNSRFDADTLWLSLKQIAELFQRKKSVISKHLKSIFEDGELKRSSVVVNHATTAADGKNDQVNNLLTHSGKISAEQAKEKAHLEYNKFRKVIDRQPSQVDQDHDAVLKKLPKPSPKKGQS